MENRQAPVKLGDKVHYIKIGKNRVTTFHSYVVRGVAFLDGKWYAIDEDRGFNVGVIGYNGAEVVG